MTDPQKDIDRLQRESDQARSTAAKARQGQPTEVISHQELQACLRPRAAHRSDRHCVGDRNR